MIRAGKRSFCSCSDKKRLQNGKDSRSQALFRLSSCLNTSLPIDQRSSGSQEKSFRAWYPLSSKISAALFRYGLLPPI